MGSHAHRRVANVGASPTGSSGVCGRPLRVLTAAHCMAHSRLALRMLAARSAPCRKKVAQSAEEACRAPAFAHASASPLPRPHSLPCALHTSTRMQSTLDTHAPRVRASPAMHTHHAATRAQKLGCRARVTGHWLPVGRLAAGTSGANALYKHARHLRCAPPSITDMLCMPSTSTVARCLRPQSLDDIDRVEDDRHDEDDREHDGRCERVRAHSHLRLLRPKSHTPARCQAPLTLLSKQDPFQHPVGHGRPSLLTPLLFSDARLLLARRVVGGGSGAAFVALCLRVLAN